MCFAPRNDAMRQNVNFQLELDRVLQEIERSGEVPHLMLHSCCGPCSTYVLEYLSRYFRITVFYYNPNIFPRAEYEHRLAEEKRFIRTFRGRYPIDLIDGDYDPAAFDVLARGMEGEPEGGTRCPVCYRFRLEKTAALAREMGCGWFCTTLSVSPYKNARHINQIGLELEEKYGVRFLPSDFKKRNGYKRSIELSHEYGLYRQDYCGCRFSLEQKNKEVK